MVSIEVEEHEHQESVVVIGLRSVKLHTLDDIIVTIRNNLFLNSVTISGAGYSASGLPVRYASASISTHS